MALVAVEPADPGEQRQFESRWYRTGGFERQVTFCVNAVISAETRNV
jgi:hypothetical protein